MLLVDPEDTLTLFTLGALSLPHSLFLFLPHLLFLSLPHSLFPSLPHPLFLSLSPPTSPHSHNSQQTHLPQAN